MNTLDSSVKMNACKNATINSKNMIATAIANGSGATTNEWNVKIIPTKASTTMCPAVMLANKRIVSANGLVNFPSSSTGERIIDIGTRIISGMSCGQKMMVLM